MEHSYLLKTLWANDNKFLHHHVADLLTSVHVTQDLPEGVTFGPCILQNSFYDTIAFIALKCSDKISKSYVFRVDAEAIKSSPNVLSWLRLVQAATNNKEQNLEAFLKSGQLYFRSIRSISKDEELLVWYDQELSHLLGFNDIKGQTPAQGFRCMICDQPFKNEYPYLAHTRFLCVQGNHFLHSRDLQVRKAMEIKLKKHDTTDFHNIARGLEHNKSNTNEDTSNFSGKKRKPDDLESTKSHKKSVLLEKRNISNHHNIAFMNRGSHNVVPELSASVLKLSADKCLFKKGVAEDKQSAFTEVRRVKEKMKHEKTHEPVEERGPNQTGQGHLLTGSVLHSSGSAFSFVLPKGAREEQKSAFCKPNNRRLNDSSMQPPHTLNGSTERLGELSDSITRDNILGYGSLLGTKLLTRDFTNSQSLQSTRNNSFTYPSERWTRQLQTSSSLTLLPSSFTSFGVAAQNWCAKCNLSFRMTSDLVFHMRSHHKKEFVAEAQIKRRREEKLTCPICHEFFRERHHLSRHMTSHN
ncbi:PR domain zinc finger protein 8-like [Acipenser ruthenus]|uniref:PR domain zinc finger protein 8-like n=1 Tax=Acipenser ruthenus TaxID=7906 RepID=UPI00274224F2|nr:PR domain zinc finger protein 8-like [Acipenser ruthenus]